MNKTTTMNNCLQEQMSCEQKQGEEMRKERLRENGLYDPRFEHDNCGIGAIIQVDGKKSHKLVADALSIVENLEHRAGKDAEGKTGDGVGILTQIPHKFFLRKFSIIDRHIMLI